MATYKEIKGVKVKTVTTDPTASEAIGTVWYNTSPSALKYAIQSAGNWSAGGALLTARTSGGAATASVSDSICAGGYPGPATVISETYNGTSWTEGNNLNTGRHFPRAFGTSGAALIMGGETPSLTNKTESYDGTSWGEVNLMNTARYMMGAAGIQTLGIIAAGGPGTKSEVETWDGTSWTETTNVNTAKNYLWGAGTSTSEIVGGGPPGTGTESWNGTSWTEVADPNVNHGAGGGAGTSNTLALIFGGDNPAKKNNVESWDGTSWTAVNAMANTRAYLGSGGTTVSTLGINQNPGTAVEEWEDPVYTIKTVTVS